MLANDTQRLRKLITLETAYPAASAELCKRSLKQFIINVWHLIEPSPFIDGPVIDALVVHLEAVTFGQIKRLLINIPPRMSKSTIVSVIWPVWDWLHHPESKFLCASYSLDLSTRDNRRKRLIVESPWFQERYGHIKIASDQGAKRFFENTQKGYMMATAVGAATTGHGGSRLILDDPHSAAEAHSTADRNAALRWFREVWSNRLNNQNTDAMVVVAQRIHEDDVSGYILKERQDWVALILPAFYDPDRHCATPIWEDWRTLEGELLWAERFSRAVLEGLRHDLGSQGFAAQYQQLPVSAGGETFKSHWLRYFTESDSAYILATSTGMRSILKSDCWQFATVDLAISKKKTADYTLFAIWAVSKLNDLLLIDAIHARMTNPEQLAQLRVLRVKYPMCYFKIESTAYQLALVQQAIIEGILCKEYHPHEDKKARAVGAAIWMENEKIFLRQGAAWTEEAETEFLTFPAGSHDEFVDVTSAAVDEIVKSGGKIPFIVSHSMAVITANNTQLPPLVTKDVSEEQIKHQHLILDFLRQYQLVS